MTPNRVVAVLTPLVFAPLAGGVAAWLAKHVPGAEVRQADLQEIFIGGALLGLAPALQWLHGWQKYEARQADDARDAAAEDAFAATEAQPGEAEEEDEDDAALDGQLTLEQLLALADLDEPLATDVDAAPAGSEG
jgi:hypothetical protein